MWYICGTDGNGLYWHHLNMLYFHKTLASHLMAPYCHPIKPVAIIIIIICEWIWEKPPSTHNYKYLEIPFVIIWSVVSQEGKQMLVWNSPRFYSCLYSTYASTVEWIASWIACHFRWKQPNGIHWGHLHLHISHKVAKSMVKLTSQSCGDL